MDEEQRKTISVALLLVAGFFGVDRIDLVKFLVTWGKNAENIKKLAGEDK